MTILTCFNDYCGSSIDYCREEHYIASRKIEGYADRLEKYCGCTANGASCIDELRSFELLLTCVGGILAATTGDISRLFPGAVALSLIEAPICICCVANIAKKTLCCGYQAEYSSIIPGFTILSEAEVEVRRSSGPNSVAEAEAVFFFGPTAMRGEYYQTSLVVHPQLEDTST